MRSLLSLWKKKKHGWWKKPATIFVVVVILLFIAYYLWKRTIEKLDITTTATPLPTPSLWYKMDSGDITLSGTTYKLKNYGSNGSTSDGTVVNTTAVNQLNFRTGSGSFYFDGTNSITVPNMSFTDKGFTITCWYDYTSVGWSTLFDFGNGQGSNNLLYSPYNGISVYQGTTVRTQPGTSSGGLNANGTWTHVAITMTYAANASATSTLKIYINGSQSYSATNAYYPVVGSRSSCYLGKSNWTANPVSVGYMDDFRYYDSVLGASQISTIYNDVAKNVVFQDSIMVPDNTFATYDTGSYTSSFPAYVPKTNMTLWLDASVDGSWTGSAWKNLATTSTYDATPFTSTTYKNTWTSSSLVSNAINGLSALYFTATTALTVAEPSGTYSNGATMFVVFQPTASSTNRTLINRTVGGISAPWRMYDSTRYVGSVTANNYLTTGTNLTTVSLNTNNIFVFRFNGPDANFPKTLSEWFNGDIVYRNTSIANAGVDTATNTYIGTRGDSSTSFVGYMGEIIVFKTNLSDMEVVRINEYLAAKWSNVWLQTQNMSGIYSVRLVNTSYYGPVVCLRKVVNNANVFQNFYTDTTQSYLNTSSDNTGTSYESWVGTSTAYVCVWYDQSGNNLHATNVANNTTQPTIAKQYCKWVLQFDTTKTTVLNLLGGQQPKTVCSHFYNTNATHGTLLKTNDTDYSLRFVSGTNVNYDANDWYYSSTGTKTCYNNGEKTTTVLLGGWNVFSMSVGTPNWSSNTLSFQSIGRGGTVSGGTDRSLTGYISEILMYNTEFTGMDMYSYYASRFF